MKTLIIDDVRESATELKTYLGLIHEYKQDEEPSIRIKPKNGIDEMNHSYELVFVDYHFGNTACYTGADVGLAIRKEYPLATMILVTGNGKQNIQKYIHVGFDAYLDKHIGFEMENLKEVIDIGNRNAQSRIKSKFDENELEDVKIKFNAMLAVCSAGAFKTYGNMAPFADLHRKGVSLEELKDPKRSLDIEKESKKKGSKFYTDANGIKHKMVGRTSLNTYLTVYEKERFIANHQALKLRQYILSTPEKNEQWQRLSKMPTFGSFLSKFDINVR